MLPTRVEILKSVTFKTSRSGGKGGQNVNKVSSKVELIYDLEAAEYLNDEEKEILKLKFANRLDKEGLLHIVSQEERSQLLNKEKTVAKLIDLIKRSLQVQKKRKPIKIPYAVVKNRLKNKEVTAIKKQNRKSPSDLND